MLALAGCTASPLEALKTFPEQKQLLEGDATGPLVLGDADLRANFSADGVLIERGALQLRLRGDWVGSPQRAGAAIVLRGGGRQHFWASRGQALEEWILTDWAGGAGVVARYVVEGAKLELQGDSVQVSSLEGLAALTVIAPSASLADGTPARVWLAVEGNQLLVNVDARPGQLLVDPFWFISPRTMGHTRRKFTATLLPDGTVLVADRKSVV